MTSVDEAARDAARLKRAAGAARAEASYLRRREAILDLRASGEGAREIAFAVHLSTDEVRRIIASARQNGDDRALNQVEANAARKARLARAAEAKAAAQATAESVDVARGPGTPGLCAGINPGIRARYVERLREMAEACRIRSPNGSAGLHHLADLHEHCDRLYPSFLIPSEGTTLDETERRFPRASRYGASSPALLCVEG